MHGFQLGREHARMLALAARHGREEQEAAEAYAYRSMALAEDYREAQAIQRAGADAAAARAEAGQERAQQERAAQLDDWRRALLASGHRPRTVAEVLAAARGWEAPYPAAQMEAARRQDMAQGEAARSQAQYGEAERLLARSADLSAAWDRDPVIVRARHASAEAADIAQGAAIEPRAAYPAREITRVCDGRARIW
jgi:hypothetical protein